MRPLVLTTLKQRRLQVAAYCLGGLAAIWMYVSIYPSMAAQVGTYNELVKSMPQSLMKAFGADKFGLTNFESLIGTKQYGFLWPLLLIFLMVSLAGNALAGEIEKTTIGLWLAAPVSRMKIFWSKYAAGLLALLLFLIFSVLAVLPIAAAYNVEVSSRDIVLLALVGGLLGWAVFAIAMLASSIFSEKAKAYGLVSVILVVMYVLNLISGLNDKLVNLKYASFFYYYNVTDLLTGGPVMGWSLVVFGATIIICTAVGAVIFSRRDISI